MVALTNTAVGFEFKRLDTNAIEWATSAGASNFHQYVDPNMVILGDIWSVDYGAGYVTTEYTGAYQFSGMTIPAGEEVSSAILTLPFTRFYKEHGAYIYGVLNADMGAPATNNLPSAQALTTAKASFCNNPDTIWVPDVPFITPTWTNFSGSDQWVPDVSYADIDITDILNELRQDPSFNDGDPVTLVWIDVMGNGSSGYVHVPNLASGLGLNPAVINYTTAVPTAGSPTVTMSTTSFKNGSTITVDTTDMTSITNALVTVGFQSQAQTLSTSADQHTFTFNRGDLPNGTGVYSFDADGTTYYEDITVDPVAGWSYINVSNPDTTEASLLFGVSGTILGGSMQFEWNTTSLNDHEPSIAASGIPSIDAGTGFDQVFARFWSSADGFWDDTFTFDFQDVGYIGSNKADPISLTYTFNNPVYIEKGADFYSVNAPSIMIVDGDGTKSINAYVNRDNTTEFIFLESGVAVNLDLATEIKLVVGAYTFSDTVGSFTNKFKKGVNGFLEVHFGELGLPVGTHNFYFVVFTATHTQGIVWNVKEDYTVKVIAD